MQKKRNRKLRGKRLKKLNIALKTYSKTQRDQARTKEGRGNGGKTCEIQIDA